MTMAYRPVWTAADVERWYVAAWRADRRVRSPGMAEALAWPSLYVLDPRARTAVELWGWARAGGHSVSALCRDRGWARDTFDRRRKRALALILAGLNRPANPP